MGWLVFNLGFYFMLKAGKRTAIMFRVKEVSPMVFRYDVICG